MLMLFFSILGCTSSNLLNERNEALYDDYIVENKLEELKKITSFRFHAWRSLDDEHLILSTAFSKPYLITLSGTCLDLNFSHAIVVNNNGSTLHSKFDSITTPRNPSFKCLIKSIHKITREQADQLSALRKSKRNDNKVKPEDSQESA